MRKYFIPFTFSIISLILFSYVFYKSEIFANGLKHEFYYKYYILSLIMIIFSIISFFIKRDLNAKIFMVFFSSILIIYIVEFAFYYKFKIAIEESYRAEFFNEFKKKNPKKVPPV